MCFSGCGKKGRKGDVKPLDITRSIRNKKIEGFSAHKKNHKNGKRT